MTKLQVDRTPTEGDYKKEFRKLPAVIELLQWILLELREINAKLAKVDGGK